MSREITKETIEQLDPRRPLTKAQLDYIIDNWSDDDEEIDAITIIPPQIIDENTDEECLDEDIIAINHEVGIVECAGTFEVSTVHKETGEQVISDDGADVSEIVATTNVIAANTQTVSNVCTMNVDLTVSPSTSTQCTMSKRRKIQPTIIPRLTYKPLSSFGAPNWTNRRNRQKQFEYDIAPDHNGVDDDQEQLYNKLNGKSPSELFSMFFDDEVLNMIVDETNRYAQQHNSDFRINQIILKRFLGILVLSGFHTLPAITDYWSSNPALGVPFVKQCMNRNRFVEIKKYLHFSNNYTLDKNDKLVKVIYKTIYISCFSFIIWYLSLQLRPLYNLINKKFMQFGIWTKELSVDEQMVPYFGRHSCKMYIRGKPIRFGYKLWCLCSAAGYLYYCTPYAGSSDNYDKQLGLGSDVVLRLLENIEHPTRHIVYFDNYFTSYHLMCLLTDKKICATGTVRSNRTCGVEMKTGKQLKRGDHDFKFDSNNKIMFCRWQDSKEVTVATNFDQIEPTVSVKRWVKAKKNNERKVVEAGKFVFYQQPLVLHNYNRGMGGVDLHDNAAQNYYINIRSKKWYWPLFIAVLNSSIVNAWKLNCFIRRYRKQPILSQKDFRVEIAHSLIMTPDYEDDFTSDVAAPMEGDFSHATPSDDYPSNLPKLIGQHLVVKISNNKKRRCQYSHCHKPASFMCKRCNIPLHTHCFEKYHIEKNIEK